VAYLIERRRRPYFADVAQRKRLFVNPVQGTNTSLLAL
jgi:hypothetical protein